MIVVFVVDTSPSMGQPIQTSGSTSSSMLSRLDLAKMAVEDLVRGLTRRVQEHNVFLQQQSPAVQKSMCQLGLGYCPPNQYLLLSTGRQHIDQPATAACGAGGRLLVGYGPDNIYNSANNNNNENFDPHFNNSSSSSSSGGDASSVPPQQHAASNNTVSFQRELKQLQASTWDGNKTGKPFPDDAGGSAGLNAAVSAGLQLLSRYRLHDRATEHFGMGRLTNPAMMTPTGGFATHALQPACLVLLTDGACLRKTPSEGGGSLQLQYGNMPLREWYKEPFRWDQRIICLGVGASKESITSTQFLHPHLRALCEVTGGYHTMLQSTTSLPVLTDRLLRILAPPLTRELPLPDPLKSPVTTNNTTTVTTSTANGSSSFVNAGPVCCFQALEGDMGAEAGGQGTVYRAMLLYTPFPFPQLPSSSASAVETPEQVMFAPPLWCIPENYFPSKKLDTLPPRPAQPLLMISRFPSKLGNKSFEPTVLIKQLHRLDQLVYSNRQLQQPQQNQPQPLGAIKLLHRDVYVCEWVSVDDRPPRYPQPNVYGGGEYFPVMVPDAGRPTSDDTSGTNYFQIGILHVPPSTSTLATSTMSASSRPLSTLTLLPPEPHILIPLLIKAADAEHRALKKAQAGSSGSTSSAEAAAAISRNVQIDDAWKLEFRNYLARLPPYYQTSMKRGLRSVLPTSLHPLLVQALASEPTTSSTTASAAAGGGDASMSTSSIPLQCFSKTCFQKIRNAEQVAKDTNERMERQEADLRGVQKAMDKPSQQQQQPQSGPLAKPQLASSTSGGGQGCVDVGYGQYDPRSGTESFLSALRGLPAPWLVDSAKKRKREHDEAVAAKEHATNSTNVKQEHKSESAKSADGASDQATSGKSDANHGENAQAKKSKNVMEILGDLPADCLMAYYESRRRWIFGGSGLTTRGLMVEGVNNDGSNVQRCGAKPDEFLDQSLLSLAGVGVSTLNETTVTKMGDYRERLLWSRSPVVGYGSNDSFGVAATTAADGSPKWSVDDDAMPMTFFDPKTGEFADSVQARLRSRLHVAFGNPFKLRWADSIVPEKYLSQCPSNHQHMTMDDATTPPGSPPHDSYSSNVEEGEAIFNRSPPPKSPPHHSSSLSSPRPPPIRPPLHHNDDDDKKSAGSGQTSEPSDSSPSASPPPPPPVKRAKTEDKSDAKPVTKQAQPPQPPRRLKGDTAKKAAVIPATPTTPPVAPPKMKTSPGISALTSSGDSPKPPPPPLKSPKTGPPPKAPPPPKGPSSGKKVPPGPPPPPPAQKGPPAPPPPKMEKKPSFSLAPSKPLPNVPLKRPSSFSSQNWAPPPPPIEASSSTGTGSDDSGKKLPPPPKLEPAVSTGSAGGKQPPSIPKPAKIESATSTGSTGSVGISNKPPPPPPKPSTSSNKTAKPPPPKPLEYTDKDKKPNVDLPPGWMCVWSKSQKRWYFFDTRSNRSVWEWPPP